MCGKTTVSALMSKGRWGFVSGLKYCYHATEPAESADPANRIMVAVPKRLFKRAVMRNLLKRRIREAYRTQKDMLAPSGIHIMFLYNTKEVMDSMAIKEEIGKILKTINDERQL